MKNKRTAFRDGLNRLIEESGVSSAALSKGSGVPKSLIDKLRQERAAAPNVYDAMRLAAFFGKTAEQVAGAPLDVSVDELSSMVGRLTPEERALVQAQLEGLFAHRRRRQEPR